MRIIENEIIENEKLWKTKNEIWSEINIIIGKKFDKDPAFAEKYLKTKIKFYNNKITANFNGKAPKEGIKYICLSEKVIDFIFKLSKNYHPQTLLEEWIHNKIKEKEKKSLIRDDIESSSDDDEENSH